MRLSRKLALGLIGGGGIRYLLRDLFTTDLAAGAVNGTAAEPGPGTRVIADAGSKISTSSGALQLAAVVADGDAVYAGSVQFARLAGRVLVGTISSTTGLGVKFGWSANQTGAITGQAFRINSGTQLQRGDGVGSSVYASPITAGTPYRVACILRTTRGAFYLVKGGTQYTTWALINVSAGEAGASYYPVALTRTGASVVDQIAVPNQLYVPSPAASDSFNRADGVLGNTDGAGSVESGGSGLAWTDTLGTWGIATNKAASSALDGTASISVATVNVGTTEVFAQVTPTRAAGNVALVIWWTDKDNHVRLRHDGTNAVLEKVVAGTPSTLVTAAKALATLAISVRGTRISMFANDSGSDGLETTVSNVTPTNVCGLYTDNIGNSFENFTVWPTRGYEILDRFFSLGDPVPAYFATGDSKAIGFVSTLSSGLLTATGDYWYHYEGSYSGYTVANYLTNINTILSSIPAGMTHILLQLGTNDLAAGLPAEATWKANYRAVIERLHTNCPGAQIGLAKPVYLQAAPASSPVAETATLHGWIDTVRAEYAYCFAGPDETTLEGGNGYVTNFSDRSHPSAAGYIATATAWQTAMGY